MRSALQLETLLYIILHLLEYEEVLTCSLDHRSDLCSTSFPFLLEHYLEAPPSERIGLEIRHAHDYVHCALGDHHLSDDANP